jgi:hypothetical protein
MIAQSTMRRITMETRKPCTQYDVCSECPDIDPDGFMCKRTYFQEQEIRCQDETQHPHTPEVICLPYLPEFSDDPPVGRKTEILSKLVAEGLFNQVIGLDYVQLEEKYADFMTREKSAHGIQFEPVTTPLFWNCDCPTDNIKPKGQKICMTCRQIPEEAEDTLIEDVVRYYCNRIKNDIETLMDVILN